MMAFENLKVDLHGQLIHPEDVDEDFDVIGSA
jgi:hypothetical protein